MSKRDHTEKLSEILNKNEMLKITEFINNSINKRVNFNDKRPEFQTLVPKQDTFSILKNIMIKNLKGIYKYLMEKNL